METTVKKILLAGGSGYIGSHCLFQFLQSMLNKSKATAESEQKSETVTYEIHVVDNLCNSSTEPLRRVEELTGCTVLPYFHEVDLCDMAALDAVFASTQFDAVIHFAGLKAVGESVVMPLRYYQNNIIATLNLIECMDKYNCRNLVFSSSATVYGDPHAVPIGESWPIKATNPYGRTKSMIEDILIDVGKAGELSGKPWRIILLRYFNPVGAHPSGRIGEDPKQPNNLMPIICHVATGRRASLSVFGTDYPTSDGTGVRDYIHVMDLANGHVAAVERGLWSSEAWSGSRVYNLGTGVGYSVMEMIRMFQDVSGKQINYQLADRRPGDIAACYANSTKAFEELGWKAELGLREMCRDAWNWCVQNPHGYA
eukprot:TRINITY_DN2038_c0_g1_i1.p1 TRINITY_DN2038_c0_g1~~TRINITY_DN2038_c0_g1_i1.p1  ORF type:complete len:369 (-),score=89.46 TRINITY_DN2038_c0_g1_i1:58-1164(-)